MFKGWREGREAVQWGDDRDELVVDGVACASEGEIGLGLAQVEGLHDVDEFYREDLEECVQLGVEAVDDQGGVGGVVFDVFGDGEKVEGHRGCVGGYFSVQGDGEFLDGGENADDVVTGQETGEFRDLGVAEAERAVGRQARQVAHGIAEGFQAEHPGEGEEVSGGQHPAGDDIVLYVGSVVGAGIRTFGVEDDAGVIVGGVNLGRKFLDCFVERFVGEVVDLGSHAEAQGVLQGALGVWLVQVGAGEKGSDAVGCCGSGVVLAQSDDLWVERCHVAIEGFEAHCVDRVGRL